MTEAADANGIQTGNCGTTAGMGRVVGEPFASATAGAVLAAS